MRRCSWCSCKYGMLLPCQRNRSSCSVLYTVLQFSLGLQQLTERLWIKSYFSFYGFLLWCIYWMQSFVVQDFKIRYSIISQCLPIVGTVWAHFYLNYRTFSQFWLMFLENRTLRGLYVQSAWTFFSWWTFVVSGHEQGLDKMYVCYSEGSRPLWPALFIEIKIGLS